MISGLCWVHPYYFTLPVPVLGFKLYLLCEKCLFCCSPEYFLCVFSFMSSKAILPSACLFFPLSWCLSFFILFFLFRSPVIWFIVFTAVNFHLVLFFFQFFIWLLPCLLRLGAALWLWFLGGGHGHPGYYLPCSWPLLSPVTHALWPLLPHPLYPAWRVSFGHLLVLFWCLGDESCCLLVYLYTPHAPPCIPKPHHPLDDPPPYCTLPPYRQPGSVPLAPRHGYSSPPSLRAAKVAKAAAAVANSSSSPVKELRDLSAMDAFRSRSISVSEHAVRRLDKSLFGNETKKQPKHLLLPPWDS